MVWLCSCKEERELWGWGIVFDGKLGNTEYLWSNISGITRGSYSYNQNYSFIQSYNSSHRYVMETFIKDFKMTKIDNNFSIKIMNDPINIIYYLLRSIYI